MKRSSINLNMSNPFIRIGDFVKLTNTQGIATYYNIISIDDQIPLLITIASFLNYNDQKIIKKHLDGRQSIDNEVYILHYLKKGQVSSRDVFMTGVPGVDINILLQLDDESLDHVCQVDEYVRSLCNSDDLWRQRLEMNYPDALKYIDTTIPLRENYVNFGKYQITSDGIGKAASDGNLRFIQHVLSLGLNIAPHYWNMFVTALRNGRINVMNWLLDIGEIEEELNVGYSEPETSESIMPGDVDNVTIIDVITGVIPVEYQPQTLDWLIKRGHRITFNKEFFDKMMLKRNLGVPLFKYIKDKYDYNTLQQYVTGELNNIFVLSGHYSRKLKKEYIQELYSFIGSPPLPEGLLSKAVSICGYGLVEFALDNTDQTVSKESIDMAVAGGRLKVLKLLESRNLPFSPSLNAFNIMAGKRSIDHKVILTLAWISENPKIPKKIRDKATKTILSNVRY